MTTAFQSNILKYITSTREGKAFLPLLDASCFDLPDAKIVFDLIKNYHERYQVVPTGSAGLINLLEYFDQQTKATKNVDQQMTPDVYRVIENAIREVYPENFTSDTEIIREEIVKFSKRKQSKLMFLEESDKIGTGDDPYFDRLLKRMEGIVRIGKDGMDDENTFGGFLLKDMSLTRLHRDQGVPTFLRKLNKMRNSGGFIYPELIIFMGAPKSFKTGTVLNIAKELVRDGLKGYVVDCENGINQYKGRFYQSLVGATRDELRAGTEDEKLKRIVNLLRSMGGDIVIDYYPAHSKTCADVEQNLIRLRDEHNWIPDFIVWDYPDLMQAEDHTKRKDTRINIQHVYHDIIRLHNRWKVFGLGISQVNKTAVGKEVIDMKDFSEDFGKAMNAHAAFAICRTEEEMLAGMARIVPVVQREGVSYSPQNQCYVEIDADRQTVTEYLDPEMGIVQGVSERPSERLMIQRPDNPMAGMPGYRALNDR